LRLDIFLEQECGQVFLRTATEIIYTEIRLHWQVNFDELRRFGKRAEFIGSSTNTKMIAKQFANLIGRSKVVFPSAKVSMKSIQLQLLKPDQGQDLVVYETLKKNDGAMPVADIVVYTSPSNVEPGSRIIHLEKIRRQLQWAMQRPCLEEL
jgi:hypothetical protein